jgi:gas vesicle protein
MTVMALARRKPALKTAAALLSLSLLLPACQNPNVGTSPGASSRPLTAEQQAMRQQSQRWNQTVATGALAGAATGAAAAAAFGRGNTGQNALIGAGIGALIGLAAGMAVADRNLGFEKREASASQRIEAAQQIAANLNNTATASEQVARQNRQRLAQLDRQFRAGQITAAQYREESETMREDLALMRTTAGEARDARQRLVASAREIPQLMNEEAKIDQAQRRLDGAADNLESALRRVPTA